MKLDVLEKNVKIDTTKIIYPGKCYNAVLGEKYYFADSLERLLKVIEEGEVGILSAINEMDENGEVFYEMVSETKWKYIYPLKAKKIRSKVTQEDVKAKIIDVKYTVLEDGRTTICNLYLENGFTVRGESCCVSKLNFDKALGEKYSYEEAFNKAWSFEAYLLAEERLKEDMKRF